MTAAGCPGPFQDTIVILLGRAAKGLGELDPTEWRRVKARTAWVRETMARLWDAQDRADAAWMRRVRENAHLSDEQLEALPEPPEPPEQAELDAIFAQVRAVVERDEWPRGLYWGEI